MTSAAVAFTVDQLAARDGGLDLRLRLESKRAAGSTSTRSESRNIPVK